MRRQPTTYNGRRLRPRKRHSRVRTIVLYMQVGVMLLFGVGIGVAVGAFYRVSNMLPRVNNYSPPEVTKIFSSDNVLLATMGQENREFVKYDQMPKELIDAVVAIEDSRFYEHAGVDFKGIARAVVKNIRGGRMMEGGSTLTQQLARNVYLTSKKSLSRKLQEAVLAILIERRYTKPKILELYLNQVYFGSSSYGVEAASKIYFGKNVNNLDLAECALIAGLPQAPSSYSPHVNLEKAINRRDVVLDRMAELHKITPEQCEDAKAEKPHIVPLRPTKYRSLAPYFTDYVRKYLRDNYDYGDDLLLRGGLRVYTTVNYRMQVEAQKALTEGIERAKSNGTMSPRQGNGSLICVEPETGYIRAMVGGSDYTKSEFNRATQAERQPGSSFKAFVYAAAVEKLGWDANHVIRGSHYSYTPRGGRTWSPKNYDGRYYSSITLKMAVAKSVNVPAVRTAVQVGLDNVIKYARLMGITSEIERYPALAIGGLKYGVHPIEMAGAYGVFATGGFYVKPTPIAKVTDSEGNLLDESKVEPKQVIEDRTAKVMDELFRAVVTSGTGRAASSIADARGKTGTTNDDIDVWFIGYVPKKLVTVVWAGNDNHTPMHKAHGSTLCLPIWKDFMETALPVYTETHQKNAAPKPAKPKAKPVEKPADQPTTDNPATPPDGDTPPATGQDTIEGTVSVRICDTSQLLATRWCPSTHTEEFVKGSEPTERCNIHGPSNGGSDNANNSAGSDGNLRLTPPSSMPSNR